MTQLNSDILLPILNAVERRSPTCMARNPRPRIIFEGVSVCPVGENNFRIEYETVIECSCRGVANIGSPGVYKILANQGVGDRIRRFDPELDNLEERIRYVRVFPARAEPILSEGRRYIRVNDLDYEHFPWGCDIILPTQRVHAYHLIRRNERTRL